MDFLDWLTDVIDLVYEKDDEKNYGSVSEDDLEEIANDLINGKKEHDKKCRASAIFYCAVFLACGVVFRKPAAAVKLNTRQVGVNLHFSSAFPVFQNCRLL